MEPLNPQDLVSTSELTVLEISIARAHGVLIVDLNGLGFVPLDWLARFRKTVAKRNPG
jgi:hypothetical protein